MFTYSTGQDPIAHDAIVVSAEGPSPSLLHTYQIWSSRTLRWRSNGLFFVGLLSCCLLLTVVPYGPVLRDLTVGHARLDCAADFGLEAKRPWYQTSFFNLCITGLLVAVGCYVLCIGQPLRWLRTLTLVLVIVYVAGLVPINDSIAAGQRVLGGLTSR